MKVCTYDNPFTMRRECWRDGQIIYSISCEMLLIPQLFFQPKFLFFGANIGEWRAGQFVGDSDAVIRSAVPK